ncbi:MAG: anthranilate phosphoribosyltransferase [Verrucomicrobiota bacterium]
MNLTEATEHCREHPELPPTEISSILNALLDEKIPGELKEDFLTALAQRGETAAELAAFAEAILPHAIDPGFYGEWKGQPLLDCCGTGGGGLNMANVSTGSMFIMAAAGAVVAKHGNRGITKKSGSSNLLEALGLNVQSTPDDLKRSLEQTGMAFIFAPAFHPAFKVIAPVRQKLAQKGQRTIFNLLGPLLNPVKPQAQIMGVFKKEHLSLFNQALALQGRQRYLVIHGSHSDHTALGEFSPAGLTLLCGALSDQKINTEATRELSQDALSTIIVASPEESAARITAVLENTDHGLLREMLLINAAAGLWTQGTAISLDEGYHKAKEALSSGKALETLRLWQNI